MIAVGNKRGMEDIYKYYYEKLLLTVGLEIKNRENTEDIVSGVLISIFKNAANYGYIKNASAWMYNAAKFAIMNFKKRNEKYVYEDFIDEGYSAKDLKIDFKVDFKRFLETLPEREREVVLLHYIYGFKIPETAKYLKVSVSTVNRDIVLLKEKMKNFFE